MSFTAGSSRLAGPRQLAGSRPGLLDPTQSARLLRAPNSTLTFAAFDPLVAAGSARTRKRLPENDPARPIRIVIETIPGFRASSRWRYVPRARRAEGVEDEGVWPRLVMVCGEPFIMSEDQWDIYKLDPLYDCFVPAHPNHPIITPKAPPHPDTQHSRPSNLSGHNKKRRLSTPPTELQGSSSSLNKKFRTVVSLVTDDEGESIEDFTESDEEDEVEEIVVDEAPRRDPVSADRVKERRRTREERAKERREKIKVKTGTSHNPTRSRTPEIVDLTMEDMSPNGQSSHEGTVPATSKRKVFTEDNSSDDDSPHDRPFKSHKRARTLSPGAGKAELDRRRAERMRRRLAQVQERLKDLKVQREQQLWEEVFADVHLPSPPSSQSHDPDTTSEAQSNDDDAQHRALIEESRRKLAELEKDRPLWEEEAQKRALQERMEQEALRLRKEEQRLRAAEAIAREEQQRQRAEAAAAEAARREQDEKVRAERERTKRRRKERERWSYGPWTTVRAIERYKTLSEEFDATKFSQDNPAEFETIPWPVLSSPVTLRPEDVDWSAVEAFFEAAKMHMRTQDYKVFVEKSHKRFHPDRWRARGVLKSVVDEEYRGCLEVAANTVAQALTPLWRESRG